MPNINTDDYTAPPPLAAVFPEPPDHTPLVLRDQSDQGTLVWRDDARAAQSSTARTPTDARWFDGGLAPMPYATVLDGRQRHTIAVHELVCTATPWQPPMGISDLFGLDDAEHLVLYRTLAQSMPDTWQRQMTALVRQYHDAFSHLAAHTDFAVQPGVAMQLADLDTEQLARCGITTDDPEPEPADDWHVTYTDSTGKLLSGQDTVVVPQPSLVPPSDRGRTYVRPYGDDSTAVGEQ